MKLLNPLNIQSFVILLFCGSVVFAQSAVLDHDLEHEFHEAEQACSIYFAHQTLNDSEVDSLKLADLFVVIESVSYYQSPLLSNNKATSAIRAPPVLA